MCGITGFLDPSRPAPTAEAALASMTDALRHRGPDSRGVWMDPSAGVLLGHRRLAIIDVSEHGHQPMVSHDGRWVLTFNGEIYNFQDLRGQLEALGVRFRGHADTDVFLEAVARWGLDRALVASHGQFAFALWDREKKRLHLARDRFGEKPLYYGWMGDVFLFASELKALRHHPAFRAEVDRDAFAQFLRFGHVPAAFSIWRGIGKVPAGHRVTIQPGRSAPLEGPVPYWSPMEAATAGAANRFSDAKDAVDSLETLLRGTIRRAMVSDVPLGVFLSGGIDSSTVTALMQAESDRPVRSFTIGFEEAAYDEAEHARRVAEHLGTDHTDLTVTPEEARAIIPQVPHLYDEPFADSSQIPTHLVSRMAREHVTVALSGDGGDELFGGYNRYVHGPRVWRSTAWMPRPLRAGLGRTIRAVRPRTWDALGRAAGPVGGRRLRATVREGTMGEKAHKVGGILAMRDSEELYWRLVSVWEEPSVASANGSTGVRSTHAESVRLDGPWSPEERMMLLDTIFYLPDDILVKVDRASMGVSLEVRAPLLDADVFSLAWRLPLSMRIRDGKGKWALRQVLHRHVPPELVERPKTGFGVPIDCWLRGPLHDWAQELIAPARLKAEGFLRSEPVAKAWKDHQSGRRDRQHQLWAVLMFQQWLEAQQVAAAREGLPPLTAG